MKIEPKSGPTVAQPPTAQATPRDRAIARLMEGSTTNQSQQAPVQNPTQVSPEEMSVVQSPESKAETSQSNTSDSVESSEASSEAIKTPKEDPLSTQYALLARKEKALRAKVQAQEAQTKAREEALIAREEALKAKEAEYQSDYIPKSRFKADPLSVLTEEGVSYDEITNAILNPRTQQDPRIVAEIEKLKAEVQQQKQAQEQSRKHYEDQQSQAYQQAITQIRNEAKQLVNSDPSFETIKETDSVNDVVDLIEKTFNSDGIILSVEEAAKEIEEYLIEEAIKLSKLKRVQERLQPKSAQQVSQPSEPQAKQPQTMKTLTNSVNASKKLSTRERAILAFKGELK